MEFNTIAISDGITMGTSGMRTSLVSREVIADSIELVTEGHLFDGVVALAGCDKTLPGTVMALARLDVPSLMLYGGSILPGHWRGKDVTILDVFEGVGAHAAGAITTEELSELEAAASPGPGACGGQFTANTMAMAFEVLGISFAGSAMVPAVDKTKADVAVEAGRLSLEVLKAGITPSQVITRESLENAIAAVGMSGGSTNGVLHLLAVAREMGVELAIDDFEEIFRRTPLLCDLKPGGNYNAADLYHAGGVPLVLKRLDEAGLLHRDAITVTGRTVGEHADEAPETDGQRVVRGVDEPIKPRGGMAILRGNLAPEGCVVKLAGHDRTRHEGPARVFEGEEDAMQAALGGQIEKGDVVVIRNEGPAGGPGMREMLAVTAAINGIGLGERRRAADRRALLRRHPRLHGRPRRPRGGARRPDRRGPHGRPGDDRRRRRAPGRRPVRRRDRRAGRRLHADPPRDPRGAGQVRQAGLQRRRGRRHRLGGGRGGLLADRLRRVGHPLAQQPVEVRGPLDLGHVAGVGVADEPRAGDRLRELLRVAQAERSGPSRPTRSASGSGSRPGGP